MVMVLLPTIKTQTQKTLKISLAPSSTRILSVLNPDGPTYLVQNLQIINMVDLSDPIEHPVGKRQKSLINNKKKTWLTFSYNLH